MEHSLTLDTWHVLHVTVVRKWTERYQSNLQSGLPGKFDFQSSPIHEHMLESTKTEWDMEAHKRYVEFVDTWGLTWTPHHGLATHLCLLPSPGIGDMGCTLLLLMWNATHFHDIIGPYNNVSTNIMGSWTLLCHCLQLVCSWYTASVYLYLLVFFIVRLEQSPHLHSVCVLVSICEP